MPARSPKRPRVLVIDIGGSNVKLLTSAKMRRKFRSGPAMTPAKFMREFRMHGEGLEYDCVSVGFPAPIVHGRPSLEPNNLGKGWKRFDFQKALGKPAKLINDAAMQALGSYDGGRMLFLGLGTGLGSALVLDGVVVPLELGELDYARRQTLEDVLGKAGFKKLGPQRWERVLHKAAAMLQKAFVADYIVLGGGNVKRLTKLPKAARPGSNDNAYLGGLRLWQPVAARTVVRKKHTLALNKL